jgi:mevalonate kinase
VDGPLRDIINSYRTKALGWKLSGAGGGGYLILVSETRVNDTIGVKIRRP